MILWLALFFLIVGISFVLAYRSMKDYQEIPSSAKVEYGLFLVRQNAGFNANLLNSIGRLILDKGLIISLERLFKGKKAALTIYGPRQVLEQFSSTLNLLELEDYILDCDSSNVSVWEMGTQNAGSHNFDNPNLIFENLSELSEEDQFFWQVILRAKSDKEGMAFQTQIRAVVYSQDPTRRKMLTTALQDLKLGELTKVPKPFSTEQMLIFYHLRSLSKDSSGPVLGSEGVMRLLKV